MADDMPVITTEAPENLFFDLKNPRLGRHDIDKGLTQDEILEVMKDWTLEELAVSFLESGFWPQEALVVVREKIAKKAKPVLVVVEGSRRLAALRMLFKARAKAAGVSDRWLQLVEGYGDPAFDRLKRIPYILKGSRKEVRAYLGFRHVTGIKEWNPAEKAEYIASLIEDEGLTYEQVRKLIGSKLPTVRQHYISYRLLLQMEGDSEEIDISKVEGRFSVLYLSLRTNGVRTYLDLDVGADPEAARRPVPQARLKQLENFARWLFGSEKVGSIVSDSRQVDEFGRILESEAAVEYLERNEAPSFAVARRMAGVGESEVAGHIERATDEVGEALKAAHQYKSSKRVQAAVKRLGIDALQLLRVFPSIEKELLENDGKGT